MRYFIIGVMAGILVFTASVSATIVSFGISTALNNTSSLPAGTAPWLTATFNDQGTSGNVILTITAHLTGTEKVGQCYFNLDPTLNATVLSFSNLQKTGSFDNPTISTNNHFNDQNFKADGDGYFDILVDFGTSDGGARAFDGSDSVQYTISGITSLTANSFNFTSTGNKGGYETAAHVQGITGQTYPSGWLTTPEPATIALLGLGGLLFARKRK